MTDPVLYEKVCRHPEVSEAACADFRVLVHARHVLSDADWKRYFPVLAYIFNQKPVWGFHLDYYHCNPKICNRDMWQKVLEDFAPLWKGAMCLSNCLQAGVDSWFAEGLPETRHLRVK